MAGRKFGAVAPGDKMMNPCHFLLHPEDLCCLPLFPSGTGLRFGKGESAPGGLISSVLPLPEEDVEVSSQHFVSYCVAAFRNCQALAFSHPGEGLHHGIFGKKESGIAPPLLSLWLPAAPSPVLVLGGV